MGDYIGGRRGREEGGLEVGGLGFDSTTMKISTSMNVSISEILRCLT